jgi:hypothetical protein
MKGGGAKGIKGDDRIAQEGCSRRPRQEESANKEAEVSL